MHLYTAGEIKTTVDRGVDQGRFFDTDHQSLSAASLVSQEHENLGSNLSSECASFASPGPGAIGHAASSLPSGEP